ncbi:DUF4912 domain-containing protein [Myxacorys almedinensis]|uniref:DUF4912 domain-containing protein n=1 Tax=Myxacorys almedinensis A TaxID=2690445 RepID=A0A8J7Z4Q7_9CYAN|nr:DUF4912 domain-containing protein [Myxacorys almedinensis A]
MVFRKQSSVINFALMVAFTTVSVPFAGSLKARPVLAQSANPISFPLPTAVPKGSTVRISGSSTMAAINLALKQRFETQYPGTSIDVGYTESATGLQDLLAGKIDLAAIGRPLTAAEKATGLVEIPVTRHKIAVVVSPNNLFRGNLTTDEFARIFRGDITNWSQVGGEPGAIRVIDRPPTSDTRQSFQTYPVFQSAPFEAGATATTVREDSTEAVLQDLGNDGIGYAIAPQVVNQPNVRIVPMHTTLPDDPRYPFSQPLSYVYRGTPSAAIAAFLGYATSPTAQSAIQTAEADPAIATAALNVPTTASPAETPLPPSAVASTVGGSTVIGQATQTPPSTPPLASEEAGLPPWLLWLLPLGVAGLLIAWLVKNRRPAGEPTAPVSPSAPPPTSAADDTNLNLASRTETVINGDRASIAESQPEANRIGGAAWMASQPGEHPESDPNTRGLVEDAIAPPNLPEDPLLADHLGATALGGAGLAAGAGAAWMASQLVDQPDITAETTDAAIASDASLDPVAASPLANESISPVPDQAAVADPWETPVPTEAASIAEDLAVHKMNMIDQPDVASPEPSFTRTEPSLEPSLEIERSPIGSDLIEELDLLESQLADDATDEPVVENAAAIAKVEPKVEPFEAQAAVSFERSLDDPEAGAGLPGAFGAAVAGAGLAAASARLDLNSLNRDQTDVEATKFDVGQSDLSRETLATVDEGLADLPTGYGESRIVLMPRDPQWAYSYWDVPNDHREAARTQGGQRLALRLYDVTDVNLDHQSPHSLQQYDCEELARDWYVPIPVSDRDYLVEIGYLTTDGRWLMLARSAPVSIPPVYPSDWFDDQLVTIDWEEDLRDKTFLELVPPDRQRPDQPQHEIYDEIFGLAQGTESQRLAGSLFGSMQQVPQTAISSFVLPSGVGAWALPTPSGMGVSGALTLSGAGFSGIVPPPRPRKFWLVADAELIVYGATEPDANLTIAGQPIDLSPDGTFRFQMSFQDGQIDYPIMAVASDGVQTRSIHLKFNRETPNRNTNPKADATDEWLS